ncbi:MAG: ATP-binding protein [Candidatus Brocadiia bacterium]
MNRPEILYSDLVNSRGKAGEMVIDRLKVHWDHLILFRDGRLAMSGDRRHTSEEHLPLRIRNIIRALSAKDNGKSVLEYVVDNKCIQRCVLSLDSVRGHRSYLALVSPIQGPGEHSQLAHVVIMDITEPMGRTVLIDCFASFDMAARAFRSALDAPVSPESLSVVSGATKELSASILELPGVEGILTNGVITPRSADAEFSAWRNEPDPVTLARIRKVVLEKSALDGPQVGAIPGSVLRNGALRRLRVSVNSFKGPTGQRSSVALVTTGSLPAKAAVSLVLQMGDALSAFADRFGCAERLWRVNNSLNAVIRAIPADISLYALDSRGHLTREQLSQDGLAADGSSMAILWRKADGESDRLARQAIAKGIPIGRTYTDPVSKQQLTVNFEPVSIGRSGYRAAVRFTADPNATIGVSRDQSMIERLVAISPRGMIVIKPDLEIEYINESAMRMLDLSAAQVQTTARISELVPLLPGWKGVLAWARELHKGGTSLGEESVVSHPITRGTTKLELNCFISVTGKSEHLIVLLADVTAHSAQTQELERAKYVLDGIPDAIISLNSSHEITEFNSGASSLFAFSADDTGRRLSDVLTFVSESGKGLEDVLECAARCGIWDGNCHVRIPEIGQLKVFSRVTSIPAEEGDPSGYVMILTDATDAQRNSRFFAALAELGERLSLSGRTSEDLDTILKDSAAILGAKRIAVVAFDARQGISAVYPGNSPVFPKLDIGPSREGLISTYFGVRKKDVLDGALAARLYRLLFEEGAMEPPRWIGHLRHEGSSLGLVLLWESESDVSRSILNFAAVRALLPTLSAALSDALSSGATRDRDRLLSGLLSKTSSAIFIFDRLGEVMLRNDRFASFFGREPRLNVLFDEVFCPPKELLSEGTWAEILAGKTIRISRPVRCTGKGECTFLWEVSPLEGGGSANGKPLKFVATGEEISPILSMMETAAEAEASKELRALTRVVGHYFNNALTVILGRTASLEKRLKEEGDEKSLHELGSLKESSLRITLLVKGLMSLAGQVVETMEEFSFDEVVREVVTETKHKCPGTALLFEGGCEGKTILAAKDCVSTIARELIRNAVEAVEAVPGGRVTIITSVLEAEGDLSSSLLRPLVFTISVADNGPGFPPNSIESSFEVFYTTRESLPGTPRGLGLPKARSLARLHNGDIRIESAPGCTIVCADIRSGTVKAKHRSEQDRKAVHVSPGRNRRKDERPIIVVLDDDREVLRTMDEMLEALGAKAMCFSEPATAEKFLLDCQEDVSALIIDHNLGGSSGPDFIFSLEAKGFEKPIFICSGYGEDIATDGRLSQIVGAIQKPFSSSLLAEKLRIFLPHRPDSRDA